MWALAVPQTNVRFRRLFRRKEREWVGGGEGKRERDWGERVGDACYKNPLLFISTDAGVRKFLIG